jgi:hypothetical protein
VGWGEAARWYCFDLILTLVLTNSSLRVQIKLQNQKFPSIFFSKTKTLSYFGSFFLDCEMDERESEWISDRNFDFHPFETQTQP